MEQVNKPTPGLLSQSRHNSLEGEKLYLHAVNFSTIKAYNSDMWKLPWVVPKKPISDMQYIL